MDKVYEIKLKLSGKGNIIKSKRFFIKIILILGEIMSLCKGNIKIGKKILKRGQTSIFLRDI